MKKAIFWVVGGAAALYFLARYRFSQKAVFMLRSLRPGGSIVSPTINLEIAVQNPTNQRIVVKSITGTVFVNDKYLANVSSFGDQLIAANSESILKLTARPSGLGVFQSVRELLTTPIGQIQVRFSGTANVDGINIPIEESKTL